MSTQNSSVGFRHPLDNQRTLRRHVRVQTSGVLGEQRGHSDFEWAIDDLVVDLHVLRRSPRQRDFVPLALFAVFVSVETVVNHNVVVAGVHELLHVVIVNERVHPAVVRSSLANVRTFPASHTLGESIAFGDDKRRKELERLIMDGFGHEIHGDAREEKNSVAKLFIGHRGGVVPIVPFRKNQPSTKVFTEDKRFVAKEHLDGARVFAES
mmetsp:Transcript_41884/g.129457  ORF Transcript_41884/g.129457 Transcript_41884/m.129457 type:complete len:210 (-) Transcript_41884:734-1363(-)